MPRDPSFPRDSVPCYVTDGVSIQSFIEDEGTFPENKDVCLKVLDFGRGRSLASIARAGCITGTSTAYWEAEAPEELPGAAPPTIRLPEVEMHMLSHGRAGSSWSKEADIWAIGCIVRSTVLPHLPSDELTQI